VRSLIAGAALAGFATLAQAQAQTLIVELVLNGRPQGAHIVVRTPTADFLLPLADFPALGLSQLPSTAQMHEGVPHVSLRGMGAEDLRLDEASLTLYASLPARWLPVQSLNLLQAPANAHLSQAPWSAYLNYRAQVWGGLGDSPLQSSASTEFGLAHQGLLWQNETLHYHSAGQTQNLRAGTRWIAEDPASLQRWIVGDLSSTSLELGRSFELGGLAWLKTYQLNPYVVRQPTASLRGTLETASQVEVYLDGVRIRTETLGPGPFELSNLYAFSGLHQVSVITRDRFGRETVLSDSLYANAQQLRAGLTEYGYFLGLPRSAQPSGDWRYAGWAASGFHRWGLSDALTLGLQAQAANALHQLGTSASWSNPALGSWQASALLGRQANQRLWAGSLQHSYQTPQWFTHAQWSRQAEVSSTSMGASTGTSSAALERLSLSASRNTTGWGQWSLGWQQSRWANLAQPQRSVLLGLTHSLWGEASLMFSLSRSISGAASTQALLALSWTPPGATQLSLTRSQTNSSVANSLQLSSATPVGEGAAWRLQAEQQSGGASDALWRVAPSVQLNTRSAIYTAEWRLEQQGPLRSQTPRLSMAGALSWLGGQVRASRPLTDAFALVQVGQASQAQAGVKVSLNGQTVGRTDAQGQLFVPNLSAYVLNQVEIDDRDVPIDRMIDTRQQRITPSSHSGSVLNFAVSRWLSVHGRLLTHEPQGLRPAVYGELQLQTPQGRTVVPTGAEGEFFLDGLAPGHYEAQLLQPGRSCRVLLDVPDTPSPDIDLGDLHVCPPATP
jgi:outer membrane usher protein